VVLQDNGTDTTSITESGTVTIATSLASGTAYTITISSQPSDQTCILGNNATGTVIADVAIAVACNSPNTFAVSATVSGLASGATLVLQDNGTDNTTATSNGSFPIATSVASGTAYAVTILTQPSGQTCTLGDNASGDVTTNVAVAVTCNSPTTYTVSASVSGLATGATLVLQDNGVDNTSITSNGSFPIATSVASGAAYAITILTQPSGQTCTLGSNASGTVTANVTVNVTCTNTQPNTFTISVAVTGLSGGSLVVDDNLGDSLTFTTNATQPFQTSYSSGATYTVSISSQPSGQACTLGSNASGTVTANVTVNVTCAIVSSGPFTLGVTVTGLAAGATLDVQDNVLNELAFTSNETLTFASTYAGGATYSVSVFAQPTGQTCTLSSNASGTITSNTTVTATCATSANYTLGAMVTGLATGVTLELKDNVGDELAFTGNTTLTFASTYASGATYSVTIFAQPTGQTCTLGSNASGTITANTTVTITCASTSGFTISVTASGLTGTLVVADNIGPTLSFTTNTTQTFSNTYASGATYSVTVQTQPTGQTCTLSSNASGTITSNITVTATCTSTATYTISVAVTGLTGTLVVADNVGPTLSFTTNTTQIFSNSYASGATYSVTVQTQPTGQTCTLGSNASGSITSNITVTATCAASGAPTISVAVSGLSGTVVLQDDQGDTLTFTSNGTQTFANSYTSGATYTVSVTSQPSAESCIPTYSTGTITSAITINATCATGSTRQLGTISGVSSITCSGSIKNGVCQQMTVSCPSVPDVDVYVKTNTPTGASKGTATYIPGTDGNGLYEDIFTYGSTAVGNVLAAGFTTVEISWGTPFNNNQPDGWALGPGGVLASACRYATVTQWIYNNIQNNTSLPYCATGNSGGAGALAYALSQYPSSNILSMAEVTSGPPPGRLDWGCGCKEGSLPVQCGTSSTLGTCFGTADAPVWDPAYNPDPSITICSDAVNGNLPPGGLNFFFGDSVEAPGALYSFPGTYVNLVFGGADNSSAIAIGQDWFNNISSSKAQVCVPDGEHSMADTLAGAQQIANDLISLCKLQ
jgi:hypothetical protein